MPASIAGVTRLAGEAVDDPVHHERDEDDQNRPLDLGPHAGSIHPWLLSRGAFQELVERGLRVPVFTRSGKGNTVFDMPTYIRRVRIQARWDLTQTSNFIVHIGGD